MTAALALAPEAANAGSALRPALYPGPTLFFRKAQLEHFRDLVQTPEVAPTWQALVARTDNFLNPAHAEYADAARLTVWPGTRNLLSRWIEGLSFVGLVTEDARYTDHAKSLLLQATSTLALGGPALGASSAPELSGPIAAIFATGHDWLAEGMTSSERQLVEDAMEQHVEYVLSEAEDPDIWWRPHHNFGGYVAGGAGLAALRLHHAGVPGAFAWVAKCRRIVKDWLDNGFDSQGAGLEGTYYALFGLTNAMKFIDALNIVGRPLLHHPHLDLVPHYLVQSLIPGTTIFDARNDATYTGLRSDTAIAPVVLALLAANENPVARWLQKQSWPASNSVFEIIWHSTGPELSPDDAGEPLAEHFEGRGLVTFRTGWRQNPQHQDVMFSIEAGPYYPTTHSQADKGHFALYGLGHRWAIDSAYGNSRTPGGRAQTEAHNCVLVDGRGQALSGAGIGTEGAILAYDDQPDFGYVLADCAEAYRTNIQDPRGEFNPDAQDGMPMERALRHALFIRPSAGARAYVVIVDDIQADAAEHDYTWQMLGNGGMVYDISGTNAVLRPGAASARLNLTMAAAAPFSLTAGTYTADRETPGSLLTVPRLIATTRAVNPRFATVLIPRPGNLAPPTTSVTVDDDGAHVSVVWPGRSDEIHIPWATGSAVPGAPQVGIVAL
ncbi:MAG: heparinase II/III family protein [Rhodoglobus sp.]|nr:heparinase II/III family protein [Rhodoglobus sp.]